VNFRRRRWGSTGVALGDEGEVDVLPRRLPHRLGQLAHPRPILGVGRRDVHGEQVA
jgi:hypothetical protein